MTTDPKPTHANEFVPATVTEPPKPKRPRLYMYLRPIPTGGSEALDVYLTSNAYHEPQQHRIGERESWLLVTIPGEDEVPYNRELQDQIIKLERERDEAHKLNDKWADEVRAARGLLSTANKERDKATAAATTWQKGYTAAMSERDNLRQQLAEVTKEKDELIAGHRSDIEGLRLFYRADKFDAMSKQLADERKAHGETLKCLARSNEVQDSIINMIDTYTDHVRRETARLKNVGAA